jgi:hypothetical protein
MARFYKKTASLNIPWEAVPEEELRMSPLEINSVRMRAEIEVVREFLKKKRLIGAFLDCETLRRSGEDLIVECALAYADGILPPSGERIVRRYNPINHVCVWHIRQPRMESLFQGRRDPRDEKDADTFYYNYNCVHRIAQPHA